MDDGELMLKKNSPDFKSPEVGISGHTMFLKQMPGILT